MVAPISFHLKRYIDFKDVKNKNTEKIYIRITKNKNNAEHIDVYATKWPALKKVQHLILEFFGKISRSEKSWKCSHNALEFLANKKGVSVHEIEKMLTKAAKAGHEAEKEEKAKKVAAEALRKKSKLQSALSSLPLIEIMQYLESGKIQQFEKDCCYERILEINSHSKTGPDPIGFNLLHWAILCNQVDEMEKLVNETTVNIGTTRCDPIQMWNVTPILLATMHGNLPIAKILMEKGADPTICTEIYKGLVGPLTSRDLSYQYVGENASTFAKRRKKTAFLSLFKARSGLP
jgi:hypothetical protein